jgi:hypothetical protein
MQLPAGFKLNGVTISAQVRETPQTKKIIAILNSLPLLEILTTRELGNRLGITLNGMSTTHPALQDYHEKIENRLFWGSQESIKQLREQLAAPQEAPDED